MQVTLKKPHTHAGEDFAPGSTIEVSEPEAQWLADQGVIDQPKAVKADSKEKANG